MVTLLHISPKGKVRQERDAAGDRGDFRSGSVQTRASAAHGMTTLQGPLLDDSHACNLRWGVCRGCRALADGHNGTASSLVDF